MPNSRRPSRRSGHDHPGNHRRRLRRPPRLARLTAPACCASPARATTSSRSTPTSPPPPAATNSRPSSPSAGSPVGAAEANMISMAAGLAATGKTVFAASFAVFMPGHCFDQIRVQIAQQRMNVKLVASHGGVSVGEDGASAQANRGPRAGDRAARHERRRALRCRRNRSGDGRRRQRTPTPGTSGSAGPSCRRVHRGPTLRAGSRPISCATDRTSACSPAACWSSRRSAAADALAAEGIEARVLNMSTLKPIDEAAIIAAARETGAIVTAEEHNVIGGLGSLVARTLALHAPTPMEQVGVRRPLRSVGPWQALLESTG